MANETIYTDILNPQILTDSVRGAFSGKDAFMGSALVRSGACIVSPTMPVQNAQQNAIGSQITVPYFGTIGDFAANNTDATAVTPSILYGTSEYGTVTRDSLAFEVSAWASGQGFNGQADPYEECVAQIKKAAVRALDARIIAAAITTGALVKSVYSATVPVYLSYPLMAQSRMLWGDESDDVVAALTHSQGYADLLQLTDASGRPLLVPAANDGDFDRFCGLPIVVSDRVPLTGSAMGAVTSAGTTPPTLTLSGTPTGAWDLKIKVIATGARDTWTFQFSTDGGQNYSATLTSASSVPLIDTAADSLVGKGGTTGITLAIANDQSASTNNVWTAKALLKARTLLVKRNSMAFWYNANRMGLKTDENILKDTSIGAMHLYGAALRYRRCPGTTRTGVVVIEHNVSSFIGA